MPLCWWCKFLFLFIYTPFVISCLEFVVNVKTWVLYTCYFSRSRIKQNYFWRKTKIMLLLSTRHSWMLQRVPLYLGCFQHQMRNPQNNQSFHQLAQGLRHVECTFFLSCLLFLLIFAMVGSMLKHDLCHCIFAATTAIFAWNTECNRTPLHSMCQA